MKGFKQLIIIFIIIILIFGFLYSLNTNLYLLALQRQPQLAHHLALHHQQEPVVPPLVYQEQMPVKQL